jgi:hypothetical protein
MNVIFEKVLKNKIIKLIELYIDDDISELILDLPLSIGTYHTIEYDKVKNELILHMFDFDFDYPYSFDELNENDKLRIYQILKGIEHLD